MAMIPKSRYVPPETERDTQQANFTSVTKRTGRSPLLWSVMDLHMKNVLLSSVCQVGRYVIWDSLRRYHITKFLESAGPLFTRGNISSH